MKYISINEIEGFQIGHATNERDATGCTVILCKEGATAGVDVRGGGPATRETDLLDPKNTVQQIHAVTLSGGSAFGLEASCGVMKYLQEKKIGFDLKNIIIPIVCQASLFDCSVQTVTAFPDKDMGYQACLNSESFDDRQGNIGAGTGASVGKFFGFDFAMKTGLGHCALQVGDLKIGAIVAVNACGDVYDPETLSPLAGAYDRNKKMRICTEDALIEGYEKTQDMSHANTTIGCIITNADLTKTQMNKIAGMTHNAYAQCIRPVHTSNDGDTIFTMTTNKVEANQDLVGVLAIKAMKQAIVNATKMAKAEYGLPSYQSIK